MQHILSIDASSSSVHAVVLEVSDTSTRVVESHTASVEDVFSLTELIPHLSLDDIPNEDEGDETSTNSTPAEESAEESPDEAPEESKSRLKQFRRLIGKVKTPWTSSVLIIPSHDYLSLNLHLPFNDDKSIRRVLGLEVQDVIPFDVSEFLLQHSRIESNDSKNDVHVGLIPRTYVKQVLGVCKKLGFEPVVVSTPSSVLAGFYHIAPDYLDDSSMIVHVSESDSIGCNISICVCVNGTVRSDRLIKAAPVPDSPAERDAWEQSICSQIRLTLAAYEHRFDTNIETIYTVGENLSTRTLQATAGRTTKELNPKEFVKDQRTAVGLAGVSGVFGQDFGAPPLLTNFRSGEFSYSPQLKELLAGFRSLLPYFALTCGMAAILLGLIFAAREYRIRSIESAMRTEVIGIESTLEEHPGEEIGALHGLKNELVQHVEGLGSPSKFGPLLAFQHISADIAKGKKRLAGVKVENIVISTQKIILEGRASEFSEVEALKKIFDRKRKVYCRVTKRPGSGQRGNIRFAFDLKLCE